MSRSAQILLRVPLDVRERWRREAIRDGKPLTRFIQSCVERELEVRDALERERARVEAGS